MPAKTKTKNMNTHTHTPGPWLANNDGLVWSDHTSLGKQNVIGAFTPADAALIASAPELLASLQELLAHLAGWTNAGLLASQTNKATRLASEFGAQHKLIPAAKAARAAIAKAKGGAK